LAPSGLAATLADVRDPGHRLSLVGSRRRFEQRRCRSVPTFDQDPEFVVSCGSCTGDTARGSARSAGNGAGAA